MRRGYTLVLECYFYLPREVTLHITVGGRKKRKFKETSVAGGKLFLGCIGRRKRC